MNTIALTMLMGDRAKYIGMIIGLTFASLLITQQLSILVGIMARTYGFITDAGLADIWVMDPKVQCIDVGTAIAGQTFYNFTLDNLRYFRALKAMGTPDSTLLRMILLQALLVGSIGYGLGVGLASLFGYVLRDTELAFRMPWQLLGLSAAAVMLICMGSALVSMRTVMRLEPAIVFRG